MPKTGSVDLRGTWTGRPMDVVCARANRPASVAILDRLRGRPGQKSAPTHQMADIATCRRVLRAKSVAEVMQRDSLRTDSFQALVASEKERIRISDAKTRRHLSDAFAADRQRNAAEGT